MPHLMSNARTEAEGGAGKGQHVEDGNSPISEDLCIPRWQVSGDHEQKESVASMFFHKIFLNLFSFHSM